MLRVEGEIGPQAWGDEGIAVVDLDDEPPVALDHRGNAMPVRDNVSVDGPLKQFEP